MKKGQTLTEYAVIIVIITLTAGIITGLFQNALTAYFNKIARVRTGILGMGP